MTSAALTGPVSSYNLISVSNETSGETHGIREVWGKGKGGEGGGDRGGGEFVQFSSKTASQRSRKPIIVRCISRLSLSEVLPMLRLKQFQGDDRVGGGAERGVEQEEEDKKTN